MDDLNKLLAGATIASAKTVPNGWGPVGVELKFTDGRTAVFSVQTHGSGEDGTEFEHIAVTMT